MRHLTLAIMALAALWASAKTAASPDTISVKRAFVEMPLEQLDLLDRSQRIDMLTYNSMGDTLAVTNAMLGFSTLLCVEKDFIEVELTPISTLQLKVLPARDGGDVVCAVYSLNSRRGELAGDSQVLFYDAHMKPIPEKEASRMFKIPEVKCFFSIPKGSATKMKELEGMVPFPTIVYTLSPDAPTMTGRLTVGEYMNQDDYNIMKLFLRPAVEWQWDRGCFKEVSGQDNEN